MAGRTLSIVSSIVHYAFWGIGYFFGFSLVMAVSFGGLVPDQFTTIGRAHFRPFWKIVYLRDGKIIVRAEFVAIVGWIFLSLLMWFLLWLFDAQSA